MLNQPQDPVTRWKAQNDHHFFFYKKNQGYFPTGYPTAFKLTKLA
jgi:hypothetical protein